MKDSKKLLAALLAVMMAASSSAVVFADGVDEKTENTEKTDTVAVEAISAVDPVDAGAEGEFTIDGSAENAEQTLKDAVTQKNAKITINGTIKLTSTLKITAEDVNITGGTIDGSQITSGNVIDVTGNNVSLTDVTVTGGEKTAHNIQFYVTTGGKLTNVKSEVKAKGLYHVPLMVNGSTVTVNGFKGIGGTYTVEVGQGSGVTAASSISGNMIGDVSVNVDMKEGNANQATVELDGVYLIKDEQVNEGLWSNNPAMTVTKGNDTVGYMSLENAVNEATGGETITLKSDAKINTMLDITKNNIVLDLNTYTITASDDFTSKYPTWPDDGANGRHLVQVNGAKNVTIKNGTIKTTVRNKNGLNICQSTNVNLSGLTIDHSTAWKGAPLIVNDSSVAAKGNLNLVTGENSWYAANVDKGNAKLDLSGANVNMSGPEEKQKITITEGTFLPSGDLKEDGTGNWVEKPSSGNNGGGSIGVPGTGTPIGTGTWKQSPAGWWYQNPDGTYPANQWKYLDSGKGYKAWYLFNQNGYITFGWQKVGNTWYYMNRSGEMQTGWQFVGNKWYYLNSNGAMATGWVKDGNKWYFMNKDGSMHFGWLNWAGYWYHLDSHGVMSTGWKQVNGKWYYMYAENGRMAANTTTPDGYRVGPDGAWIK